MGWGWVGTPPGILAIGLILFALRATGWRRGGRGKDPAGVSAAELDELRARVTELEQERGHLAELEERLDFAERMLAQKQDVRELRAGDKQ